jgi:two-component system alkaline phosphatase synthesis response regulator PhoP
VVQLTEREAEVLSFLASNRTRAISRDELLRCVWGLDPRGVRTRTVDMLIARLRERLGDDKDEPKVIQTVRAKGYMLAHPQAG